MDQALQAFPLDFQRRLEQIIPKEKLSGVVEGLTKSRVTTFRVNTLKMDAVTLIESLVKQGITSQPVSWIPNAFILKNASLRTLTETRQYRDGLLYVQSLSSMIPALILDPKPGEKVLDVAAAPGSKTTQIAMLMQNTGSVIANDTSQDRLYRLKANLSTQGVMNTTVIKKDGRSIWQNYPEYFDRVLVDAPCSLEGRFTILNPQTFRDWSLKKIRDLSILERWLLRSAVSATKKGGSIVYATCTLSPEENEGVIDWLLKKDKNSLSVEQIDIPTAPFHPAITHWAGKMYDPQIVNAARIYPSMETEGFFVVKLRKIRSTVPRLSINA